MRLSPVCFRSTLPSLTISFHLPGSVLSAHSVLIQSLVLSVLHLLNMLSSFAFHSWRFPCPVFPTLLSNPVKEEGLFARWCRGWLFSCPARCWSALQRRAWIARESGLAPCHLPAFCWLLVACRQYLQSSCWRVWPLCLQYYPAPTAGVTACKFQCFLLTCDIIVGMLLCRCSWLLKVEMVA